VMDHYSVLILSRVADAPQPYTYTWETVYFGEGENMMRVKFFDAVRMAQTMPAAHSVVVYDDRTPLVRGRINDSTFSPFSGSVKGDGSC
jgi:hypothetical protein